MQKAQKKTLFIPKQNSYKVEQHVRLSVNMHVITSHTLINSRTHTQLSS